MSFYDDIETHRRMVGDKVRLDRFHESIAASIRPGDVVLDVGAGSGILSLLAARAGASRVYAVERAPGAVALARRLVADNGLADRVKLIEANIETAAVSEPADVIVSEWLGVYGVDENLLAPVVCARDRWLKPGGLMIPSITVSWIAPVYHEAGVTATAFHQRPYGLDLSALDPFGLDDAVWLPNGADPEDLRADPQKLWSSDPARMTVAEARAPYAAQLTFTLARSGVNGVVAWFSAQMPGGGELSNAPGKPATHWGNFLFPIANASGAQAGDALQVGLHCVPSPRGGSHHLWSCRVNDGPLEVHDTRRKPRLPTEPPWRVAYAQ